MLHKLLLKQSFNIIKTHILLAVTAFLLGVLIFPSVMSNEVGKIIFSTIATILYALSIYSSAYDVHSRDKKSYTPQTPYRLKGLFIAVPLFILTAIIYALYYISWRYMTINGTIVGVSGWINHFLFLIWSFPFFGFLDLSNGVMNWYGYVIIAIVPFFSSFLGYLAGFYGFDLNGKINQLIYEKKKQEEKK